MKTIFIILISLFSLSALGDGAKPTDDRKEIRTLECKFPAPGPRTQVLKLDLDSRNQLRGAVHYSVDEKTVLIFSSSDVSQFLYDASLLQITASLPNKNATLKVDLGEKPNSANVVVWTNKKAKFEAHPSIANCSVAHLN